MWVQRLITFNVSGDMFRNGIRVIPGEWTSFEAVYIFPLEKENLWIEWGLSRWITNMDDTNGVSKINSLQNGILLWSDIHQDFNQYAISVNPDVSISLIKIYINEYRDIILT
ncbi:hypothetical protein BGX38DRAFT_1200503 [Terfezia claveryi]|nr:hypothetical protein BGX38DRAFT_1200503 [Terfezia claveryi]